MFNFARFEKNIQHARRRRSMRGFVQAIAITAIFAAIVSASADEFPVRPITPVVPFAAGGRPTVWHACYRTTWAQASVSPWSSKT
jgi:hypothetical protein